jgi:hypothetical protein
MSSEAMLPPIVLTEALSDAIFVRRIAAEPLRSH